MLRQASTKMWRSLRMKRTWSTSTGGATFRTATATVAAFAVQFAVPFVVPFADRSVVPFDAPCDARSADPTRAGCVVDWQEKRSGAINSG
jgi:hypothetical protein